MAKFDASTAVEKLDYDFSAYGGSVGTIPEPTTGQVETFFKTVRNMAVEVQKAQTTLENAAKENPDMTDADAAELLSMMPDEMVEKYKTEIVDTIETLCSGTPSAAEIRALPYRVLSAFNAWLAGEIRPEAQRPGTPR